MCKTLEFIPFSTQLWYLLHSLLPKKVPELENKVLNYL